MPSKNLSQHPPESETDEQLAEKSLRQDGQAFFRLLVERHESWVLSYAHAKLGNYHEAEEAAQLSFIRLYHSLSRYDSTRPFRPWLFSIVSRSIARQWKSYGWWKQLLPMGTIIGPEHVDDQPDRGDIWRIAAKVLSHRDFSLLWLHYGEGMNLREASLSLGISENVCRTAMHRSRKKMRREFKPQGMGSELCFENQQKS